MAVVFAMMTSYLLSRTLVPTMVHYLLASEVELYGGKLDPDDPHADPAKAKESDPHVKHPHYKATQASIWALVCCGPLVLAVAMAGSIFQHSIRWGTTALVVGAMAFVVIAALRYVIQNGLIWKLHEKFDLQFEKLRQFYGGLLAWSLDNRLAALCGFIFLVGSSIPLVAFGLIGKDFFPSVDAGQIRLHVRAAPGTRLEQTERIFADVEKAIKDVIPADQIETLLDNIGIPNSGINLSLSDGSLMSSADGEILIALKSGHPPTIDFMDQIDHDLREKFPDLTFYFAPPDMVTQVLNFGIAAPIDVQIEGSPANQPKNYALARKIASEISGLPGAADVRVEQVRDTPALLVNVDRTQASYAGLTQRDVANDMLVSLSGTAQQNPNFWEDTIGGVQYSVLVQTPQYRIDSINTLTNQPVIPSTPLFPGVTLNAKPQLLGGVAKFDRGRSATNITHYNPRPTYDILAGVRGTDLNSVAKSVRGIIAREEKQLSKGTSIKVRGQVESMDTSFTGLSYGLIFAIILVYLIMVVNFQSWLDPLIILMALPGAIAGILWMLFVTQTTINVPSLMGAIMSIGVATANSILMITFANDQRREGADAHQAALAAGMTRLRPVIMTALAMIIGMLPMALGLGEGGEQNAPLGRAVIGGLLLATFATLFFVPIVYSTLRKHPLEEKIEPELRT
jgi:multidrug efflux pump subunit AcrB